MTKQEAATFARQQYEVFSDLLVSWYNNQLPADKQGAEYDALEEAVEELRIEMNQAERAAEEVEAEEDL